MTAEGPNRTPPGDGAPAGSCTTCADAASWMRVLDVDAGAGLARCVDEDGRTETVATELVGDVAPEDALLVHAGTAIHRAPASSASKTGMGA